MRTLFYMMSLRGGNADEAIQPGLPRSRWSLAMTSVKGFRLIIILSALFLSATPAAAYELTIEEIFNCAAGKIPNDEECALPLEERPYSVGQYIFCQNECQYNIISSIREAKFKTVNERGFYESKPITICIMPGEEDDQSVAYKFSEWYENNEKDHKLSFKQEAGRIAEELYPCLIQN